MSITCLPDRVLDAIDDRTWYGPGHLCDAGGRDLKVGDTVLRASTFGRTALFHLSEVTRIEDGKLYLDNSKVPIQFTGRLLIVHRED